MLTTRRFPTPASQKSVKYVRAVAKGIELTQEIRPDGSKEGPQVITVLKINPQEKGVRLEAALGKIVFGEVV